MVTILEASPRTETGKKLGALRAAGILPGVVYGPKEGPVSFSISRKVFEKVFEAAGESTILTLKGVGADKDVLVQEVAYDPVLGHALHVDLYAVEQGKSLKVNVEFDFTGEAPALKLPSTVLTKVLYEIEVECMPRDMPSHIDIDLSKLAEIGDSIHVRDIPALPGVEFLADPDDVIVVVSAVEEEVEAPVEAVDMAAIDVEKKGKKEEEEVPAE
ncbi:50S ribosomal protein L25 [Patescibacteria group bacterium]|nr:50S ribosomal protein L25 [Patescibacteria group bacterium]